MNKDDWTLSPTGSGLAIPIHVAQKLERPIGIDLFCGAGGFSLGYLQAGWKIIAGMDNDPASTVTYLVNLGAYPLQFHFATPEDRTRLEKTLTRLYDPKFKGLGLLGTHRIQDGKMVEGQVPVAQVSGSHRPPDLPGVEHFFFGDARKFDGHDMLRAMGLKRGEVACVFGGPPCQGFSRAGKRNVMDPRNSLVFEFARLVTEIQPKTLVFENVPGIVSMVTPDGIPVLDAFCHILADGGFGVYETLRKTMAGTAGIAATYRTFAQTKKKPADPQGQQLNLL